MMTKFDEKEFELALDSIDTINAERAEFVKTCARKFSGLVMRAMLDSLVNPAGPTIAIMSTVVTMFEVGVAYGRAQATRELLESTVKKEES